MTFTTPLKNGGKFPLLALGHVGGHVTATYMPSCENTSSSIRHILYRQMTLGSNTTKLRHKKPTDPLSDC